MATLTEQDVGKTIADMLLDEQTITTPNGRQSEIHSIKSYRELGVLTMDKGMVIHMQNGQSFHVTIQEN